MEPFELSRSDLLSGHIDSEECRNVVGGGEDAQVDGLVRQSDVRVQFDDVVKRVPLRYPREDDDPRVEHRVVLENVQSHCDLAKGSDEEEDSLSQVRHFLFQEQLI